MQLILGTSCHLPSGSDEDEFERLYNKEIKPLVSAVYRHPGIQMTIHYSGVLLHWIERRHPELIMLLEELLTRKQAELLGGGFYEPVLPLLHQADKVGQVEMLTTYLRKQFGRRPQGCWIPSLAWEQNLVGPLNASGMGYTFLEDFRFASASPRGGKAPLFFAPGITEDQGKLITVFPISSGLGKNFYGSGTKEKLEELASSGVNYPVSVFPRPSIEEDPDRKYQKFFEELSKTSLEFTLPGRIYKNLKGLKRLYFRAAREENGEKEALPREFLTQYPEANGIYAKMVYTRTFINNLRGDKTRKRAAIEELWKAQDSGIFSPSGKQGGEAGISRNSLRKAAYRALLDAEKITREKAKFSPSLSIVDFDLDGEGEYLFQDDKVNAYIKAQGAALFELDYLPASCNYLDTFIEGCSFQALRRSFSDYLVPGNAGEIPSSLAAARFCGDELFEAREADRVHRKLGFVLAPKEGILGAIELSKIWQMKKNLLCVRYSVKNTGSSNENFFIVPRICFSFPEDGEESLRVFALRGNEKEPLPSGKSAAAQEVNGLEFRDIKNESVIVLEVSRAFSANILSAASGGAYQFTEILPALRVSLEPGKSWEADFSVRITS